MPEKLKKSGFTLIELCIVLSILAILAGIAAVGYGRYRITQYDSEAIATLVDLRLQAAQAMSEWGVAITSDDTSGIPRECIPWTPVVGGVTAGLDDGAIAWNNDTKWSNLGLRMDGIQHWSYEICFGGLSNADNVEGVVIVAVRKTDAIERIILFGTAMQEPLVGVSCIPKSATVNVAYKTLLGVEIKACD